MGLANHPGYNIKISTQKIVCIYIYIYVHQHHEIYHGVIATSKSSWDVCNMLQTDYSHVELRSFIKKY